MAGLYKETTLGKDDLQFLRMYKSIDQLSHEMESICYHPPEKWVSKPPESAPAPGRRYMCDLKDFYAPRDDSDKQVHYSRLNPYPTARELNDMLYTHDEYGPMEDYDDYEGYMQEPDVMLDSDDELVEEPEAEGWVMKEIKKHVAAKVMAEIAKKSVRKKK